MTALTDTERLGGFCTSSTTMFLLCFYYVLTIGMKNHCTDLITLPFGFCLVFLFGFFFLCVCLFVCLFSFFFTYLSTYVESSLWYIDIIHELDRKSLWLMLGFQFTYITVAVTFSFIVSLVIFRYILSFMQTIFGKTTKGGNRSLESERGNFKLSSKPNENYH